MTPLFYSDWDDLLMIHFAIDPKDLQNDVPLPLDTFEGDAFITLVAFSQRNLRIATLGKWTTPFAGLATNHDFLNARTYVNDGHRAGIHFIAEYVNNPLARFLGPALYGLPYRLARMRYAHDPAARTFEAHMKGRRESANIVARYDPLACAPAQTGTLERFLHERYTAYNCRNDRIARFEVAHPPWQMRRANVDFQLRGAGFDRLRTARFAGAYVCPKLESVAIGKPIWNS